MLARVCVVALVVLAAPLAAGRDPFNPPPSKLIHSALSWADRTRPEPWTADSNDHRVLAVYLSYRADAPARQPLVVFSTGRNVASSGYQDLADALADAGYVAAVVDHVGERSGQRLPNGTAVPNRLAEMEPKRDSPTFAEQDLAFSRRWVEIRAEDLTSARTHLQTLSAASGNELSGRLNDRVAAVGHSIGGLTAAKTCERDASVSACVNLDGLSYSVPMHMDANGAPPVIKQPFLFIGKPIPRVSDATLAREHTTRAEDDAIVARFAKQFDDVMRGVQGGSYRVLIDGADHMNFTGAGNGPVARIEKAYLLAFLERYLQGGAGALLAAVPTDRTVTVTRYR